MINTWYQTLKVQSAVKHEMSLPWLECIFETKEVIGNIFNPVVCRPVGPELVLSIEHLGANYEIYRICVKKMYFVV